MPESYLKMKGIDGKIYDVVIFVSRLYLKPAEGDVVKGVNSSRTYFQDNIK